MAWHRLHEHLQLSHLRSRWNQDRSKTAGPIEEPGRCESNSGLCF